MTIFLYLSFCIIWSFDFSPKNCHFTLYTYLFIHFKLVNSKLSTNQITCLLPSCSESTNQRPPLRLRLAPTSSGCAESSVYELVADFNGARRLPPSISTSIICSAHSVQLDVVVNVVEHFDHGRGGRLGWSIQVELCCNF